MLSSDLIFQVPLELDTLSPGQKSSPLGNGNGKLQVVEQKSSLMEQSEKCSVPQEQEIRRDSEPAIWGLVSCFCLRG